MERDNTLLLASVIVFVFSLIMLVNQSVKMTGYATEGTTISNVSISKYLSITLSTNLSEGILFGSITSLPASDWNATHNFDGDSSGSTMFVNVSQDSNTAVDICIKANTHLTDSGNGNILGIGNETYRNSTTTDGSNPPGPSNSIMLNTTYVKGGAISPASLSYYRFWLDVPSATPSGTYNNSVSFKGVENSGPYNCGS